MILQGDLQDFAVLAWVRDEAGAPIYRLVRQGIKLRRSPRRSRGSSRLEGK